VSVSASLSPQKIADFLDLLVAPLFLQRTLSSSFDRSRWMQHWWCVNRAWPRPQPAPHLTTQRVRSLCYDRLEFIVGRTQ
jgi:hypothetical protein